MPSQLLRGSAAEVTTNLSLAFNGTVPSNPIYTSYTAEFTRVGEFAMANSFAAAYSNTSNAALATQVLTNLGVTATTIGSSSYATLASAVETAFAAYPTARGQVALNLARLLSGLEADVTYGAAATAWNNNAAKAFTYSSSAANTASTTLAALNATPPVVNQTFTLTTGVDSFAGGDGNDTFNTNVASLGALDVISGGAGTDTLNVVDTATAFTGFGGASISGIETVNISTGGAVGSIASAAGTTTAAVAQRASFSVATTSDNASTVAAGQKYNVTIGGVIYETAALDNTPTLAEANSAIRDVLTTVLGDQATIAAGVTDSVTSSGVTTDTTRLTVTSNVAGKALPTISIANQTGGLTSIGAISTTATSNPSISNVTGTGPLAIKEVVAITFADAASANNAAVDLSTGDVLDVYVGGVKYSNVLAPDSMGAFTLTALASQVATVINSVLGAGSAVAGGPSVTVTAPVAGTPLPVITTSVGTATDISDSYSALTSNIAANAAASSAALVAAPTGTTAYSVTASGVAAVSAATTSTITVSGTAVQTSGGSDVTVAASNSVRVSGAKGAVSITTGTTSTTLVGAVAADSATGTAGNAAGVYVTGGTTVSITGSYLTGPVKVGTTPYASASVNTTGGLPQVNGSISLDPTGDVSISRGTSSTSSSTGLVSRLWSADTAGVYMNGGTTATVRGAGATTITDVGTLSLLNASGVATIGTSKLATVNLSGLSGTANITSDAIETVSVSDSRAAVTINVLNSGAVGANTGSINYVLSNVGTNASTRVTLSNATDTVINISSGAASTYSGSRNTDSASFVTLTSANATTINLTNSLPVNIGDVLATAAKVGTISGGSATGAISLTIDSTPTQGMALTTGSGNDVITVKSGADLSANATTAANTTVNLGAGNDSLLNLSTAVHGTTGASFNGGDGTDTVAISFLNAGNTARFTNFEVLGLDLTANGETRDTAIISGITGLALLANGAGNTVTYNSVKAAQGLTVASSLSATGVTALGFETAVITGAADAYTVTFAGTGTTSSTAAKTAINAGVLSLTGIETVNIASGSATGFTNNTVALRDASATSLVITGSQYATVTFDTAFGSAATSTNGLGVTTVDASANTSGVSLTFPAANVFETAYSSFSVKGSSGSDTIVMTALDALAITVDGGAGDDSITTPASKALTLTGGAGKDTFIVGSTVYGGSGFTTTITDIGAGDAIRFVDQGTETFASTKVDISAATSLATALGIALSSTDGSTNAAIKWFQYGGNTYVVQCLTNNGAGLTDAATTDLVVKLNGVVDLSGATLSGNTLTYGG